MGLSTMEEVYMDTDYKTPLIFILSPGADPLVNLIVKLYNLKLGLLIFSKL